MKTISTHFRSPPRLPRSQSRGLPQAKSRGSLLIVAMLLSAIIGISLVSYLQLSRTTHNVSNRAFFNNAAMNLAEQGLEEAMYSVNTNVAVSTYAWPGWTLSGGDAYREFSTPTGTLSQDATATYRVYVYNYAVANPAPKTVISRARVTLGGVASAPIDKWIHVVLRKTSKFANGLVAKDIVRFNGTNATVDSWNSDPDNLPGTAAIPYGAGVKQTNGSVASLSVVSVNQADIFGYVATGTTAPAVGANGKITGNFSAPSGTVDPTRVDTNFSANFDPVVAPSGSYSNYGGAITTSVSLPRAGIDTVMGTGDYATYHMIEATSVNFTNNTLTITGKVILKLTNTLTAIDISGPGGVNINTGAELQVYGSGDFSITGQGILNGGNTLATANQPINCQFYGTKTSGVQNINITGNGVLSAVVYAPQGSITITGNGDVMGSMVGNDITLAGNALFHYDESLADFGVANPYRIQSWTELTTAAERTAAVAAVINFTWP